MKIKAKELEKGSKFNIIKKGDWIDLRAAETVEFAAPKYIYKEKRVAFDSKVIKLGVAMKLPAGLEAVVVARSGLYKLHPVLVRNSMGVIDNSYSGNTDEWKLPLIAMEATTIKQGERICQFRVQLSQKATMMQKIKWLCTSSIEIEWVDNLDKVDRGGFGSTGVN